MYESAFLFQEIGPRGNTENRTEINPEEIEVSVVFILDGALGEGGGGGGEGSAESEEDKTFPLEVTIDPFVNATQESTVKINTNPPCSGGHIYIKVS